MKVPHAALLLAAVGSTVAQEPVPVDLIETERVRLVILDTVVVDAKGRTVPGLTRDDFDVVLGNEPVSIDTFDADCDAALDDPVAVAATVERETSQLDRSGKIALVFDYLHLAQTQRAEAIDHADKLMSGSGVEGEEILIVALDGSLRIEQPFTSDRDRVRASLRRMQQDITLWEPSFEHLNETGWVTGVTTLLDVLGSFPGPKKVVLFSGMGDVPLDLQFREIAAQAAATRCAVYPVDVRGLTDHTEVLDAMRPP